MSWEVKTVKITKKLKGFQEDEGGPRGVEGKGEVHGEWGVKGKGGKGCLRQGG